MKRITLTVAVDAAELADTLETLGQMGADVTLTASGNGRPIIAQPSHDGDDDDVVAQPVKRANAARATTATPQQAASGNRGRAVVYTPVGTQRQITAALDKLRKGTLSAYVLTDIVKHPETSKRDMLARLGPKLAKAGLSVESVDNVVWNLQKRGAVASVPVDE